MVVKVHCETVLGDEFVSTLKNSTKVHFDNHLDLAGLSCKF